MLLCTSILRSSISFENNRDNFGVLVFVYPFDGNNDEYRVNAMTKYEFADIGERHGLVLYEAVNKFWVFVRRKPYDLSTDKAKVFRSVVAWLYEESC